MTAALKAGHRLGHSAGLLVLVLALGWLGLRAIPAPLLVNRANGSVAVLDRDGQLLHLSLTGDQQYRLWAPLSELPPALIDATLNYEDRWFGHHPGINPIALLRAAWSTATGDGRRIGGSTLTMQLARQRWRLKTQTLVGKLEQIVYALWLERLFSKPELLEAYLNLAPYGANIQGAAAAAWVYFHKPVARLNPDEARALALLPQNPRRRAPLTAQGRAALREAWTKTYRGDSGFERLWFRTREDLPRIAPHFAGRVAALYPSLASLPTTLDAGLQRQAEHLLAGHLRRQANKGIDNATVLIVHAPTMEVLAYIGSADFGAVAIQGYVNGLTARRSPGSALKPFIYALALDQGLITPDTLLNDTPLQLAGYRPENFEGDFLGPLSATEALVRSRNIPAVALAVRLQRPSLFRFLRDAGVHLPRTEIQYGPTLAIGGAELSMEQMLSLYGMLANGGEWRELRRLRGIAVPPARRLLSAEAAYLTRTMLEANPPPDRAFGGRRDGAAPLRVVWKTGTSSGLRDAWAIGLMGDYLAGVWVGHFDGTPNRHLVGREMAGPLLFDLFDALRTSRSGSAEPTPPPSTLKRIEICPVSGAPRSPVCPHGTFGWIIPGVSPLQTCTVHREIHVDPSTGLRLCRGNEARGKPRIAEFWQTDVLESFKAAGLRREPPPPFETACEDLAGSDRGLHPPQLISPEASLQYPIRPDGKSPITFSAVSDRNTLHWFVDDAYVGAGTTLLWPARPGRFTVRVVDDQGQSASTELKAVLAE